MSDTHQQVSSTPKSSYKPLASVTPFVPLSNKQQQQIEQQNAYQTQQNLSNTQQQTSNTKPSQQQSSSMFSRDKYPTEGIFKELVHSQVPNRCFFVERHNQAWKILSALRSQVNISIQLAIPDNFALIYLFWPDQNSMDLGNFYAM